MTVKKDVHIGHEIERVLHKRGMTVTEFAKRICCHRKNVYSIFQRKSLDIDHIIRISEVLDYDFIRECYYGDTDNNLKFTLLLKNGRLSVEQCEE